MPTASFTWFQEMRPAALVVSHERSGTHFLINALATCYGYVGDPWLNLDYNTVNINYHLPRLFREELLKLATAPMANVGKSHHAADFLVGELSRLTTRYIVFVIYRDPVAVLLSNWRLMHSLPWMEGPKVADPITFARSEPCGKMLRYQIWQYPNMMRRWAAHVEGWLAAAAAVPRVVPIRYEDLNTRYEEIMRGLEPVLERPPQSLIRPDRNVSIIPGGPEDPTGLGIPPDIEGLRRLCRETVGDTMRRLGY
jgi:hypothetical protein